MIKLRIKYSFKLLICTLFIACASKKSVKVNPVFEQEDFKYLDFLFTLKKGMFKQSWIEFTAKDTFSPIIYYTTTGTYVLNPNKHILSTTKHTKIGNFRSNIPVILLANEYTDTDNFQFHSSFSSDKNTLYYNANVLSFQSFKLTQKFIPDVEDIQDWAIMVIHELFHGYQRAIPAHKEYYTHLEIPNGPDAFLGNYYNTLPWFKESVQIENNILKGIWLENKDLVSSLKLFDSLRGKRINRIKKEFAIDIKEVENYEITNEGNARYIESLAKRYVSKNSDEIKKIAKKDSLPITSLFDKYDLKKDKALYNIYDHRYYYAMGYNISMILEKYFPNYKKTIYKKEQNIINYLKNKEI